MADTLSRWLVVFRDKRLSERIREEKREGRLDRVSNATLEKIEVAWKLYIGMWQKNITTQVIQIPRPCGPLSDSIWHINATLPPWNQIKCTDTDRCSHTMKIWKGDDIRVLFNPWPILCRYQIFSSYFLSPQGRTLQRHYDLRDWIRSRPGGFCLCSQYQRHSGCWRFIGVRATFCQSSEGWRSSIRIVMYLPLEVNHFMH